MVKINKPIGRELGDDFCWRIENAYVDFKLGLEYNAGRIAPLARMETLQNALEHAQGIASGIAEMLIKAADAAVIDCNERIIEAMGEKEEEDA